tara:strand:+ start:43 stop:561 length:519 start_codon:yes stop_codon:yes gene_type:complete
MNNLREKLQKLNLTTKQNRGFQYLFNETQKQRNNYLKSVMTFETAQIEKKIKRAKTGDVGYGWSAEEALKSAQYDLNNNGINFLNWLTEADSYFDSKLLTMVSKLEKFGFLEKNIMFSDGGSNVSEGLSVEFYIRAFNTELKEQAGRVYARLIWVECYEKASHYRFICTLKK